MADRTPIPAHLLGVIDALLRQPRRLIFQLKESDGPRLIMAMAFVAFLGSLAFGAVVGTFSGGAQIWAASVKVTIGIAISGMICLPSLYILTCLSGSQARLVEVAGFLAGLIALTAILLVGFAPIAWIFSQSTSSLIAMGALHLVFWFIATFFGVRFLSAGFSHSKAKSRLGLGVWFFIFVLVSLQMSAALRPIIGRANTFLPNEKEFFLGHWADCVDQAIRDTPGAQSR